MFMHARQYQVMVHSEEGHLTGLVEKVSEGDEGIGLLQVQDQHCGDEGHALDLGHTANTDLRPGPNLHYTHSQECIQTTYLFTLRPLGVLDLQIFNQSFVCCTVSRLCTERTSCANFLY